MGLLGLVDGVEVCFKPGFSTECYPEITEWERVFGIHDGLVLESDMSDGGEELVNIANERSEQYDGTSTSVGWDVFRVCVVL